MRRTDWTACLAALAALAVAGCGQPGGPRAAGSTAPTGAAPAATQLTSALTVGTVAPASGPVLAADDHGDAAVDATALALGEAGIGLLEGASDADWFVVQLAAGAGYDASVASPGAARVSVLAADGRTELASNRTAPGEPVSWQASAAGVYYVRVEPVAGPVDYALLVEPRSAP